MSKCYVSLLFILTLVISGCASKAEYDIPVERLFHLTTKNMYPKGDMCVAAFNYKGVSLLYTGRYTAIYSHKNNLLFTGIRIPYRKLSSEKCDFMPQRASRSDSQVYVYKIYSEEHQRYFSNLKEFSAATSIDSIDFTKQFINSTSASLTYWGADPYAGRYLSKRTESEGYIDRFDIDTSDLDWLIDNIIDGKINGKQWPEIIAMREKKVEKYFNRAEKIAMAKASFQEEQKQFLEIINSQNKYNWDTQKSKDPLVKGDSVCNMANHMGFIEEISGDRLKVLWVAKVKNENEGFWFGKMPFYNMSESALGKFSFNYEKLNDFRWVANQAVSHCEFNI
ncbi:MULTISPECIES: hypothetical protein [unclassified Pseudoalteromonas]|uniref:hypothetical protein n=1 Tax=unclassified Pseudoalteromonas TaxID=194690 RepID=UPI0005A9570E|nr:MULTISPECIES: hypothetical protein [unclassified Pseudoalteromonas]